MYQISFKYSLRSVEDAIEKLNIEEIFNVFYTPPFEVITTDYGYEYEETLSDELIDVNVIVEEDNEIEVARVKAIIGRVLGVKEFSVTHVEIQQYEPSFEPIDLGNGWIVGEPDYYEEGKQKMNFIPQGAFGTGLHETTQECLRYILNRDLSGLKVIDLGTGSGILSIAASLKNASKITAVDIRDVREEIEFNSDLNDIANIDVVVGDVLKDSSNIDKEYDLTIINIGGEETDMFMKFIDNHTKQDGTLLVSGLVEWSFEKVIRIVEKYGFKLEERFQTNEWCTAVMKRSIR